MKRRTVLKAAGSTAVVYLGYQTFTGPSISRHVSNVNFEILEERPPSSGPDAETDFEGPNINTFREENSVVVSGSFVVGNRCYEARLSSIQYKKEEIIVNVDSYKPISLFRTGCGDAEWANAYKATFTIDTFPKKIIGVEKDMRDNEYITTIET